MWEQPGGDGPVIDVFAAGVACSDALLTRGPHLYKPRLPVRPTPQQLPQGRTQVWMAEAPPVDLAAMAGHTPRGVVGR
jgi:hypothetical protein